MKAIAEYFRDLAAEDRYFGAEPPQPDAAMLHRIAEREIQRRVEAKIQDNGVILRAGETDAIAAPRPLDRAAPAASQPETAPQPVVDMPARAPATRPAPVLAQPATAAVAEGSTESVAEKLSRLRKAAAQQQEAPQTAAVVSVATPIAEEAAPAENIAEDTAGPTAPAPLDQIADNLPEDEAEPTPEALPEEDAPAAEAFDALQDDAVDAEEVLDLLALDVGSDAAPPVAPEAPATVEEPDLDLAAVLAQTEADDAPEAQAEAALDDDEGDDAMLASLVAEAAAEDEAEEAALVEEAPADADDALLVSLAALVDPEEAEAEETASETQAAAAPADVDTEETDYVDALESYAEVDAASDEETDAAEVLTPDTPAAESETEQEPEQDQVAAVAAPIPAAEADATAPVRPVRPVRPARPAQIERPSVPADLVAELAAEAIAETESRTPISVEKLQRARARVIKIRRSETSGSAELAPAPAAPAPAAASPAVLSAEAEAALAAELASLEQDSPAKAAPAEPTPDRRAARPAEDVPVNRLMAEASTQMEVPDAKRRQSAIAHLKAAVAATIAERRATGSTLAGNGSEKMGAYRNDLAKVMRPAEPPVPQEERPSPLVLVSEQRVDRPAPPAARQTPAPAPAPAAAAPVQPVRPRRPVAGPSANGFSPDLSIAAEDDEDDENIFDVESGFPEFAERLGATELHELLEAAAAYIACVEGRDSFTRPQLMRHISAASEGLSREDGLRSFGTLLRDGVIERSRRGQFAINQGSPLLAEARKFAG
ncbi:hypothetical protein G3572_06415 [Rhodobacter sp. ETT8]|uniref:Uncharacterized protein n=2 Tax=Pseudotabrizicola algicola TaxID=2709381 RepID=A0A6B3RIJ4_9RHOB|nr:hypothetical protein [Pseudotabrizicola algicola]